MRGIATTTSIIMCLNPTLLVEMRAIPTADTSGNTNGLSTVGICYTSLAGGVVMSIFSTLVDACTVNSANLIVGRA